MCLRTVNIDEARLRRINPLFSDVNVIDRWLEEVIADAINDMELLSNIDGVMGEETRSIEDARARTLHAVSREYALKHDMTPEELYAVIMEDVKAIYDACHAQNMHE